MTDLFLIAHKVRGEPAFDVAHKMDCPICVRNERDGMKSFDDSCSECDGEGFWWVIPTSGHRAYPGDYIYLWATSRERIEEMKAYVTESLPDHYPTSASPSRPAIDIRSIIPPVKIHRRF